MQINRKQIQCFIYQEQLYKYINIIKDNINNIAHILVKNTYKSNIIYNNLFILANRFIAYHTKYSKRNNLIPKLLKVGKKNFKLTLHLTKKECSYE